jgi:DNA-binding YbaB/EbfC family protein
LDRARTRSSATTITATSIPKAISIYDNSFDVGAMKNLGQMMRQAQEMQERLAQMQASLGEVQVTGVAGGGMVQVTVTGKTEAKQVKIDPSLLNGSEAGVLEDLLVAAFNDARAKVEVQMAERMSELTGGLPLPPGFKLPF